MSQRDLSKEKGAMCKRCYGAGVITCFTCNGRGVFIKVAYGFPVSSTPCSSCHGTGVKRTCELCKGTGFVSANE